MDSELRTLERDLDEADPVAVYRYRLQCVRAGRPEDALPLRKGDIVQVEEIESPWIKGPWHGVIMRIFNGGEVDGVITLGGDGYIKPLAKLSTRLVPRIDKRGEREVCDSPSQGIIFRVRPTPEYISRGLYVTRADRKTLLQPAVPHGL